MKPKDICHIMASVDGHIQVERFVCPAERQWCGMVEI